MTYELGDHWALRGDEDVGDPDQNAARKRVGESQYVRGFIVVGMAPGDNTHTSVIEHSFSMDVSKDRANIWLHRKSGDFGGAAECSAQSYAKSFSVSRAPTVFKAYDIDDPACPVGLDWVDYERRVLRAAQHARGVNKFDGRNRVFYERDTSPAFANAWYSGPQIEELAAKNTEQEGRQ